MRYHDKTYGVMSLLLKVLTATVHTRGHAFFCDSCSECTATCITSLQAIISLLRSLQPQWLIKMGIAASHDFGVACHLLLRIAHRHRCHHPKVCRILWIGNSTLDSTTVPVRSNSSLSWCAARTRHVPCLPSVPLTRELWDLASGVSISKPPATGPGPR